MIRIGTRGSKLALWQANDLKNQLQAVGHDAELHIIKTKGDKIQNLSFDKIEGKGFFTKEIEDALLNNDVDLAVHSMKDLPTQMVEGLVIAGLSTRANPADVLVIKKSSIDTDRILKVKEGGIVGTSAVRRKVQLKKFDKTIVINDIRGNVPTRLNKLKEQDFDAIVLAAAGVERLAIDLSEFEVVKFNPTEFIPSPAQGIIAYQCRKEDKDTRRIVKQIHNSDTSKVSNVERTILKLMDGGCQLPLGAYCYIDEMKNYHCYAAYAPNLDSDIKTVHLSQNTFSGLAERIVEKLKN